MNPSIIDMERQLALEETTLANAATYYENKVQEARVKSRASETEEGIRLIKRVIEPLTQQLQTHLEEHKAQATKPILYLSLLEPQTIAFITLKTVINEIHKSVKLTRLCVEIASHIEDEVRLNYFQKENSPYFKEVNQRIRVKSSYEYKRTVLIHAMGKIDIPWATWSHPDKLQLGGICLDLLRVTTGFVEYYLKNAGSKQSEYLVQPTDTLIEHLSELHEVCRHLNPTYLPMLVPPKPWTTHNDGGYYGPLAGKLSLITTFNHNYLDEMANREMPMIYEAVNTIQETPWQINRSVLSVFNLLWRNKSELAGLPWHDKRLPRPCPIPPDLTYERMSEAERSRFLSWKREAAFVYESNIVNRSKFIMAKQILDLANQFQDESALYFPHRLDFRGRVYPVPAFLNPQSSDLAKGLLVFANGKPIQDKTAADWLAIHGANLYGFDKASLEERVAFIEQLTPEIFKVTEDPLKNLLWVKGDIRFNQGKTPDKPWQFLAFCFEWTAFKQEGYGFVSHLPIALDGTCNGIQHFSAMLRDEVGGEAVNLIPSEKPQDIYQRVADRVVEKLQTMVQSEHPDWHMARIWLSIGISRSITKRPVMILPYGGTRQACRQYVEETLRTILQVKDENPFALNEQPRIFEASNFLAGVIWEAIAEVVVAARDAMDWLRKAATLASKEGLPINWTTPSGFLVQQAYRETQIRRITTKLSGNLIRPLKLSLAESTEKLDIRRQANGISPNFVHSMDAAVLHLYVNRAKSLGIDSYCLIHDSYGTLAADTALSVQCIRDVFVEMYQEDVLNTFRSQLLDQLSEESARKLPPIPHKGTLDLALVKQSAFFFA